MKKAIGYIRISDKDQSNFSISGQEKYIREYCERHNIYLHSIFTDEKSAKDFDRRAWQKLEDFMRTSYRDVDYLIVIKYDRFSRNAAAGLSKIELLEKKYHVIVVSIFEQMSIDYESALQYEIETLQEKSGEYWHLFEEQLPKLSNIGYVYNMGTIAQKQSFVRQVFNSELRYADGVYRTPYLLELFQPKAALLKEKRLLVYEKPLQKRGNFPVVPRTGIELISFRRSQRGS